MVPGGAGSSVLLIHWVEHSLHLKILAGCDCDVSRTGGTEEQHYKVAGPSGLSRRSKASRGPLGEQQWDLRKIGGVRYRRLIGYGAGVYGNGHRMWDD